MIIKKTNKIYFFIIKVCYTLLELYKTFFMYRGKTIFINMGEIKRWVIFYTYLLPQLKYPL